MAAHLGARLLQHIVETTSAILEKPSIAVAKIAEVQPIVAQHYITIIKKQIFAATRIVMAFVTTIVQAVRFPVQYTQRKPVAMGIVAVAKQTLIVPQIVR